MTEFFPRATLKQWWANDTHQQWAWQWDFYLEV
jgi:hypothetical protein